MPFIRSPTLANPHRLFPASVTWRLGLLGVTVTGSLTVGTPGPPATVRRVWQWFGEAIRTAAITHEVPVELLIATIATESAGGQTDYTKCCTARREEPGWISDTATPGRVSLGVGQVLISTARAVTGLPLSGQDLIDPTVNINATASVIAADSHATLFDPPLVAAKYNAGGLYRETELANRWKLRCYPLGTGAHIDRFVAYFNDAMQLPEGHNLAGKAPSFLKT